MNKITGKIEIRESKTKEVQKNINNLSSFAKEIKKYLQKETTELLETMLLGGLFLSASDIHLEPKENSVRIRLRTDGMLHDVISVSLETHAAILSRIKLLAGLKLNIHDRPQDGSFSVYLSAGGPKKQKEIEIRTSALPSNYGESLVMRILNPESLRDMEELGLREDLLQLFKKEIQKPNGMIIVTGPTGSGKTTTLYAFLKYLQKPEIKIITIEDPIEYRLENISQTQVDVKKGYDFANGLRSIVRQDPDIILVGEVRDMETAEISLQAALTGHLVLTTLHTNDAAGAIPRLTSLGAKPVNIGPAINMVIAQRLIRKVCQKCARFVPAEEKVLEKIKKATENLPKNISYPKINKGHLLAKPKGCDDCHFTGYKGRLGIYEAFLMTDELESLVLQNPSIPKIKKLALEKGMTTMYHDGIIRVLDKITTIEEVERVTSED
jgi:type II secretory ATPase GspE/PulE/Tfp pilus assembly ATPase PilB-like protein